MNERKDSEKDWMIYSVAVVVGPVIISFILSSIMNGKVILLSEVIESVILVVFSITCNLLSICKKTAKQKSNKLTYICFYFSGTIFFLSLITYIFSLTYQIKHLKTICLISSIIVIICSILGIKLAKMSDKNENDIIHLMHENCDIIRKNLIDKDSNEELYPLVLKESDLLCNPNEFSRVKAALKNIKKKVKKSENQK